MHKNLSKLLCFFLLLPLFSSCLKKKAVDGADSKEALMKAVDSYRAKILNDVSNPKLHFELAGIYEKTGDDERAMQEYRATVMYDKSYDSRVNPKIAGIYLKLARNDMQAGNVSKALEGFKSVLALSPELGAEINREILAGYQASADKKLAENKFAEAMTDYAEVLKIEPKNEAALTGQVACLIGQKKYNDAQTEIEKLNSMGFTSLDKTRAELKIKLADESFAAGDYAQAKTLYDDAVLIDNTAAERLKKRFSEMEAAGLKKSIEEKQYDQALEKIKELNAVLPDPKYALLEADIYEKQQKRDMAISKYTELSAAEPKNKTLYNHLIRLYKDDKNLAEEIAVKKKFTAAFGLKENREFAEDIVKYDFSRGNYKDALGGFAALGEAFPSEARYFYEQAAIHTKMKEFKKALSVLEKAEKMNPKLKEAYSKKFDPLFRMYLKKNLITKIAISLFSAGVLAFGIIKFLSRRRMKLVYQAAA